MTYDDFDATILLLDAAELLREAELLQEENRYLREDDTDDNRILPDIATTLARRTQARIAEIPSRKAKLLQKATDLRERCTVSMDEKREFLDDLSAEFDREEPDVDKTGRFYQMSEALLAEEIARTDRVLNNVEAVVTLLNMVTA